mgnify:CR=1 FL=1
MRLNVISRGSGPPIVFLHGLGASATTWNAVAETLSDRHLTMAVDLLGHGESPCPDDPEEFSRDAALADQLDSYASAFVVSAGFMKLLGPQTLGRHTVVNTHPALLPAFPGAHAVRDALAYGVTLTGTTCHLVDAGVVVGDQADRGVAERHLPGEDRLGRGNRPALNVAVELGQLVAEDGTIKGIPVLAFRQRPALDHRPEEASDHNRCH